MKTSFDEPKGSYSGRPFVTSDGERFSSRTFWAGGMNNAVLWVGECCCGYHTPTDKRPYGIEEADEALRIHVKTCEAYKARRASYA